MWGSSLSFEPTYLMPSVGGASTTMSRNKFGVCVLMRVASWADPDTISIKKSEHRVGSAGPQPRPAPFGSRESLLARRSNQSAQNSCLCVDFCSFFQKFTGFLFHASLNRLFFTQAQLCREFPDILRDFHRTKVRAAHGTEVRGLCAFLRQRF